MWYIGNFSLVLTSKSMVLKRVKRWKYLWLVDWKIRLNDEYSYFRRFIQIKIISCKIDQFIEYYSNPKLFFYKKWYPTFKLSFKNVIRQCQLRCKKRWTPFRVAKWVRFTKIGFMQKDEFESIEIESILTFIK